MSTAVKNQIVCFDEVDLELLNSQYEALINLLSVPDAEDHICWGLVEMLGDTLDTRFTSMIDSDL